MKIRSCKRCSITVPNITDNRTDLPGFESQKDLFYPNELLNDFHQYENVLNVKYGKGDKELFIMEYKVNIKIYDAQVK